MNELTDGLKDGLMDRWGDVGIDILTDEMKDMRIYDGTDCGMDIWMGDG